MRFYRFERTVSSTEFGYFSAKNEEEAKKIAADLIGPVDNDGDVVDQEVMEVISVDKLVEEEED